MIIKKKYNLRYAVEKFAYKAIHHTKRERLKGLPLLR